MLRYAGGTNGRRCCSGDVAVYVSDTGWALMRETFIPSSSNLAEVSYDSETQTMQVTFKTGNSYEYRNVPQSVYMSLQRAPSPGSYFYRNIRQSYAATEV